MEHLAQQSLQKSADKTNVKYTTLAKIIDTEETLQFLQGEYNHANCLTMSVQIIQKSNLINIIIITIIMYLTKAFRNMSL